MLNLIFLHIILDPASWLIDHFEVKDANMSTSAYAFTTPNT